MTMTGRRLLKPAAVFTGRGELQRGWHVLLDGERIAAVGPADTIDAGPGTPVEELPGATLLPGLMDLHSHVLLYPYDRTSWNDQVLREPQALRVARATNALRATLAAGFTLLRDLGTEGAGYADVGLRSAVAQGVIPGPRLVVVTKAIVATGTYGPKGFAPECGCMPIGAEEADGIDALTRVVRDQIRRGADWIKVYADIGWGPHGEARPTFTLDELKLVVELAESSGRHVAAHASTAEGMRRAALAGVRTIEHGNDGTPEVFALMAERGVALCPTIAAYEAIISYGSGGLGGEPFTPAAEAKFASMRAAIASGVTIVNGSDVGVFEHGDNARELEALVRYGLSPRQALEAATSVAAEILDLQDEIGTIAPGMIADLVAVGGDPSADIAALNTVRLVVQRGAIVRPNVEC
jgi:imidazolonepropionase-like amidohydrolase